MRRLRCHYSSAEAFLEALKIPAEDNALQVYTTERFEPGEEVLAEVFFTGLPGKMMVRAIGKKWQNARPRLRVRAGGVLRCTGSEWRKLLFLKEVAAGNAKMEQRRRHVRQPVLVEIRWRRAGDPDLVPATISEISEAGALLLASDLAIGDDIIIEITPPGSARPLEVQAVVRNTNHDSGAGVEFLARDMGGVHRIREVIRRIVDE
ncbi:MAG: PilZ domain-containing protein [Nannocystaceae bacterium]